ncbi:MAG: T9SS type A sorting domain-containing protein, partial [Bacteroidetes bacterium]|nr:T9SS type A sorting domain-containing protein [Bacteroidota bacterium]
FGAGKSLSSSENISIKLFPNPVIDGELNISLEAYSSEVELLQIRVYDTLGQLVLDEQLNQNKGMVRVDVSSLSSGVYTLQFSAGDTQSSGRFFIK